MNLFETFQDLVAQVPQLLQPVIVALAGAIPFIEGEGATAIGIIGGIHPVIAVIAAVLGNFACVAVLVLLSARARSAVVSKRRTRTAVPVGVSAIDGDSALHGAAAQAQASESPRQTKFRNALERYGVPGVSLLGPLLLPTQFTATMLAATGVSTARVLFWQAVAIIGWSTAFALIATGVVSATT